MRIIFLSCFLLLADQFAMAQKDSTDLYLRFPEIPPFTLTQVPDSLPFVKADLNKKKATLIMLFSPDCEHCQHEMNELKKHIRLFKKIQIVMASPVDYTYIKKFYEEYQVNQFPNITMGRDGTYMLGTFYHIRSFPALFLYNKKGKFVKAFSGSVPVAEIPAAL